MNNKVISSFRFTFTQWILILFTVGIGAYLIVSSVFWIDSAFIGGRSKLLLRESVLRLNFKTQFKLLEIQFSDRFITSRNPQFGTYNNLFMPCDPKNCTVEIIDSNTVRVRVHNDNAVSGRTGLSVWFRERGQGDIPQNRFITGARVDYTETKLKDFYERHLISDSSNVEPYKPFDIRNISNTLATLFGESIVLLVTILLLIMLATQLFTLLMSFWKQYLPSLYTEVGGAAIFPLNWIDGFAANFATFFGFLGTVLSIWVGLEKSAMDYGDFFQVLSMVKYAVFTTVLGLMIRIIYGVRMYLYERYSGKSQIEISE